MAALLPQFLGRCFGVGTTETRPSDADSSLATPSTAQPRVAVLASAPVPNAERTSGAHATSSRTPGRGPGTSQVVLPGILTPRTAAQATALLPDNHLPTVILQVSRPRQPVDHVSRTASSAANDAILAEMRASMAASQGPSSAPGGNQTAGGPPLLPPPPPPPPPSAQKSRLLPVWSNSAMLSLYNLSSTRNYQRILTRLAARDPLLVYILEKAVRHLPSGRAGASTQHVTADPQSEVPSLMGLRFTPCWWQEDSLSQPEPAIVVQHSVPFNSSEVVPRVLRDYFTLNLLPTIVTVATFTGQVLYQNASSLAYFGDFSWSPSGTQSNLAARLSTPLNGKPPSRSSSTGQLSRSQQPAGPAAPVSGGSGTAAASGAAIGGAGSSGTAGASGNNLVELGNPVVTIDLTSLSTSPVPDEKNLVKQLFNMDPEAMEEALEVLSATNQWSGVIQVPRNMRQHLRTARQQRRHNGTGAGTANGAGGPGAKPSGTDLQPPLRRSGSMNLNDMVGQLEPAPASNVVRTSRVSDRARGIGPQAGPPWSSGGNQGTQGGSLNNGAQEPMVEVTAFSAGSTAGHVPSATTQGSSSMMESEVAREGSTGRTWESGGTERVPSMQQPQLGGALAGEGNNEPGMFLLNSATGEHHPSSPTLSPDSYEFDLQMPRSGRWGQTGLETVQEAEVEVDVDLEMGGDDDNTGVVSFDGSQAYPHSQPFPTSGPLGQVSSWPRTSMSEEIANGASQPSRERPRDSIEAIPEGSPFLDPPVRSTASAVRAGSGLMDGMSSGRASGLIAFAGFSGSSLQREPGTSGDRSFSLSKSVTAVLDVIERKRISHLDAALQSANGSAAASSLGSTHPTTATTGGTTGSRLQHSSQGQSLSLSMSENPSGLPEPFSNQPFANLSTGLVDQSQDTRSSWQAGPGPGSFNRRLQQPQQQAAGSRNISQSGAHNSDSCALDFVRPGPPPNVPPGLLVLGNTSESGAGLAQQAVNPVPGGESNSGVLPGRITAPGMPSPLSSYANLQSSSHANAQSSNFGTMEGALSPSFLLSAQQSQTSYPAIPAQSNQFPSSFDAVNALPIVGPHPVLPPSAPCWHEVTAFPMMDPVLDQRVLLITQTDVTKRVDVERKLAELTSAQMSMLEQMFPRHVIEHMLSEPGLLGSDVGRLANDHEMVSVLFADVVGFTTMSKEITASAVMMFLNTLYSEFDAIIEDYGLYQLDTMGDCYIVASGLVERDENGFQSLQSERTAEQAAGDAHSIMQFAKAMLVRASQVFMPHNGQPVTLRVGIHSGRLVSGMLGTRLPKFTLFGDTMNTASRMESTCKPSCIQVSAATYELLQMYSTLPEEFQRSVSLDAEALVDDQGVWASSGGVEVKGKGVMETFLYLPASDEGVQGHAPYAAQGHIHFNEASDTITVPQMAQLMSTWGGAGTITSRERYGHGPGRSFTAAFTLAHGISEQLGEEPSRSGRPRRRKSFRAAGGAAASGGSQGSGGAGGSGTSLSVREQNWRALERNVGAGRPRSSGSGGGGSTFSLSGVHNDNSQRRQSNPTGHGGEELSQNPSVSSLHEMITTHSDAGPHVSRNATPFARMRHSVDGGGSSQGGPDGYHPLMTCPESMRVGPPSVPSRVSPTRVSATTHRLLALHSPAGTGQQRAPRVHNSGSNALPSSGTNVVGNGRVTAWPRSQPLAQQATTGSVLSERLPSGAELGIANLQGPDRYLDAIDSGGVPDLPRDPSSQTLSPTLAASDSRKAVSFARFNISDQDQQELNGLLHEPLPNSSAHDADSRFESSSYLLGSTPENTPAMFGMSSNSRQGVQANAEQQAGMAAGLFPPHQPRLASLHVAEIGPNSWPMLLDRVAEGLRPELVFQQAAASTGGMPHAARTPTGSSRLGLASLHSAPWQQQQQGRRSQEYFPRSSGSQGSWGGGGGGSGSGQLFKLSPGRRVLSPGSAAAAAAAAVSQLHPGPLQRAAMHRGSHSSPQGSPLFTSASPAGPASSSQVEDELLLTVPSFASAPRVPQSSNNGPRNRTLGGLHVPHQRRNSSLAMLGTLGAALHHAAEDAHSDGHTHAGASHSSTKSSFA